MREYVFHGQHNFKALETLFFRYLHHLDRKVWWLLGICAGLLIPSSVFAFWYRPAVLLTQPMIDGQPDQQTFSSVPNLTKTPTTVSDNVNAATTSGDAQSSSSLKVNNQLIPLPSNGTIHKEIHSGSSTTTVDVSTQSSSSSSAGSSSSLTLDINSQTTSNDTSANPPQAP